MNPSHNAPLTEEGRWGRCPKTGGPRMISAGPGFWPVHDLGRTHVGWHDLQAPQSRGARSCCVSPEEADHGVERGALETIQGNRERKWKRLTQEWSGAGQNTWEVLPGLSFPCCAALDHLLTSLSLSFLLCQMGIKTVPPCMRINEIIHTECQHGAWQSSYPGVNHPGNPAPASELEGLPFGRG